MTNTLKYLPASDVMAVVVDERAPMHRSSTGYGGKIPTRFRLVMTDKRTRRVYAMCWSNAATFYVLVKGETVVLSSDVEHDVHAASVGA